jgi:hypothetical protein
MWNFIGRKHARETDGLAAPDSEDGRQWVWVFAPEFRLMIAAIVGPRTLTPPRRSSLRPVAIPRSSATATCYLVALIAPSMSTTFARTGKRGVTQAALQPPDLVYGQLASRRNRAAGDAYARRAWTERLTHLGYTISTALVEQVNLTLRQVGTVGERRPVS